MGRPARDKEGLTEVQRRKLEAKRKYDADRRERIRRGTKWGSPEHREKINKWGLHLRKASGYAATTRVFGGYRWNAKIKGVPFDLSREEFCELIAKNCHYCGLPPAMTLNNSGLWSTVIYNGVDRVDNSLGYTKENSVPCCKFCNLSKRNLSVEEFLGWVERIHLHQRQNRQ